MRSCACVVKAVICHSSTHALNSQYLSFSFNRRARAASSMAQWAQIKSEGTSSPFIADAERESKFFLGFNNMTKVRLAMLVQWCFVLLAVELLLCLSQLLRSSISQLFGRRFSELPPLSFPGPSNRVESGLVQSVFASSGRFADTPSSCWVA